MKPTPSLFDLVADCFHMDEELLEVFRFPVDEIRKHPNSLVVLSRESATVWEAVWSLVVVAGRLCLQSILP